MKKSRFTYLLLFFIFINSMTFAQARLRIAVLPFEAVDVSISEAQVVTSLFEAALLKTGVFNVIEQNDIDAIMEAQSFSLSGCADDACAVEVGQLLSAEQIIIGAVSFVGGRYIANAKIIDVTLGTNINADSVSAEGLAELTEKSIVLLAYKLAGLTAPEIGTVQIASSFGELFIRTDPQGAEILINGISRGTSPLILDNIPLGILTVTASKGDLKAEELVTLDSSDLVEVNIALQASLGRLYIQSSESDVMVFLDGEELGSLGTGLFRDQPVGEHNVVIRGDGLLYEGQVIIEEGKTTRMEVYPYPAGTLTIVFPEDAEGALVVDKTHEISIRPHVPVDLRVGEYTLIITGQDYVSFEETITLYQGQDLRLEKALTFTHEGEKRRAEMELRKEIEAEKASLSTSAKSLVAKIETTRELYSIVTGAEFVFPELIKDVSEIHMSVLTKRIDELYALKESIENRTAWRIPVRWISFGTAAGGAIVSGVMYLLAQNEQENYNKAQYSEDAVKSRELLETYSILIPTSLGVGVLGTMSGTILSFRSKELSNLNTEIIQLSKELSELNGEL